MPGNSPQIRTGIDRLLRHVQREDKVSLENASDELGVDSDVVLSWAHALEDAGIIEIHHSATKGRILISREPGETEEDAEGAREDAAEDIQELETLREEETDIDHFQDLLDRMERALEEDEEEAENLEDVMKGENLDTLHEYIADLRAAERGVSEMEERLDGIATKLEALRKAEELEQGEGEEKKGIMGRLAGLLPWKNEKFRCEECGKEFETARGKQTHRGMVHRD